MKQSAIIEQLAKFVLDLAQMEPRPSKEVVNLTILNWFVDESIQVYSLKGEGDV